MTTFRLLFHETVGFYKIQSGFNDAKNAKNWRPAMIP